MSYIASHYYIDIPLAWSLRLDNQTDQARFKELGWGLRTWDDWRFADCDKRFGDDWSGRRWPWGRRWGLSSCAGLNKITGVGRQDG